MKGTYSRAIRKDIWADSSLLWPPEDILPLHCDKCSIAKNRLEQVPFPSRPILRKGRILVLSEYPSYTGLPEGDPNPLHGTTWDVLDRVCYYLQIGQIDFSYSTIIRCWRKPSHMVTQSEYTKCREYVSLMAAITEAPVIITLGSMVTKFSFPDELTFKDGKFIGTQKLRTTWTDKPHNTIYGIPGVPTEHPSNVRLVRCNTQINFRTICVDFMRAIDYAAKSSNEYAAIAASMERNVYRKDYEELLKSAQAKGTVK